jgi:hypothetical protein
MFDGTTASMMCFLTSRRNSSVETLSLCCVEIQPSVTPHFAQLPHQFVRHHDRQRHQLRRLVGSVPEHQPLIACPARIHAHRDIRGLALDGVQDAAGGAIETIFGVVISDLADHFPYQLRHVHISCGRDLAGHYANPRR